MRQAGEPSVDEILNSIKKVIARDDRADGATRQNLSRSEPDDDDDVLDLAVSARFLAPADEAPQGTVAEPAPLVTDTARAAMRESLAALALMAEPPASPQAVRAGDSLEEMVREMLRPALAAWLDQHLPAMVERMVASEIARIVGKKP